jgi:hypothetical protein
VNPAVKIGEPVLKSGFILLPCHAIDSRRSLTLEGVEAVAKKIDVEMMEQSGEPFLFPFPCCFTHTVQPLGHAFPSLCREHVWLIDVLLHLRSSLPGLRRKLPSLVRSVHR